MLLFCCLSRCSVVCLFASSANYFSTCDLQPNVHGEAATIHSIKRELRGSDAGQPPLALTLRAKGHNPSHKNTGTLERALHESDKPNKPNEPCSLQLSPNDPDKSNEASTISRQADDARTSTLECNLIAAWQHIVPNRMRR